MKILTVYFASKGNVVEIPPRTSVMDALSKATGNSTNEVVFACNGEQFFHGESVKGDVANKVWEVVCLVPTISEQFSALEEKMVFQDSRIKLLEDRINVLEGTVLFDWIRNVATTILLFIAGSQPYSDTTSNRFQSAKGDFLYRITNYVNASSMWEINKFKKLADDIISRRNEVMHPTSLENLNKVVESALDAIQRCRRIRITLKQETSIIEDYEEIKKYYPTKCAHNINIAGPPTTDSEGGELDGST